MWIVQSFHWIQPFFEQEKSFYWNFTDPPPSNASRLIILTREPSMHAGSKPEHGEEEKKQTQTEEQRMKGYVERPCRHSTKNLRAVRQ